MNSSTKTMKIILIGLAATCILLGMLGFVAGDGASEEAPTSVQSQQSMF